MNQHQKRVLQLRETDTEGALKRCGNSEQLYEQCLKGFLADLTIEEINFSIDQKNWDDAFTAAHALKGVAGNMGFFPLMHKTSHLVILIRGGRTDEIPEALYELNSSYRDIIDAIHQYFLLVDKNEKEDIS